VHSHSILTPKLLKMATAKLLLMRCNLLSFVQLYIQGRTALKL
jgi:hypothetical protein